PPSPRGGLRGTTMKIKLSGHGVGSAKSILFPEPGIDAQLVKNDMPDPNSIEAELTIAPNARPGLHALRLRTAFGTTSAANFVVSAKQEAAEQEPNDEPSQATNATLPATILGTIDKAGDMDLFRFDAKAGVPLVFELLARPLGSSLSAELDLLDDRGTILAT